MKSQSYGPVGCDSDVSQQFRCDTDFLHALSPLLILPILGVYLFSRSVVRSTERDPQFLFLLGYLISP